MKKIKFLEQSRWLMVIMMLITFGVSQVWADALKVSDLNFGTPIVNENFNSLSTCENKPGNTSSTTTLTDQTAYGVFSTVYVGKSEDDGFAIRTSASPFSSQYFELVKADTKFAGASFTHASVSTQGAFEIYVAKTSKGQFGFYTQALSSNANAGSSVYFKFETGTNATISCNNGGGWTTAGTSSSSLVRITVVYNTTNTATSYGNSISLGAKRAHVYIDGTCVMNGDDPKAFVLYGSEPSSFRVWSDQSSSMYVDDIKVWSSLPTGSMNVTYHANGATGGTVPTDNTDYSSGNTVTVKTNEGSLVRTGCTFSGWNTAADGSGTTYPADGSGSFTITENTTLYAKWAATVTWNDNGGVIRTDNIFVPAAGKSVTPPSDPSTSARGNCGDKFMGWTKEESYKDDDEEPGDLVNGAQTVTGSANYYAVFADKKPVTP